jgi:hypothetical protein
MSRTGEVTEEPGGSRIEGYFPLDEKIHALVAGWGSSAGRADLRCYLLSISSSEDITHLVTRVSV